MAILLQVFTVGTAALIPISTGADRWRLRSICISTALLAGCCYPLFAHWVWGGGWLAQLGSNFNLGHGFLDSGGASTIQVIGGLSGLAIAWTLGPRRGKYTADGTSAVKPGHNLVYVLFGCAIALPGWIALNSAGAILFADAPLNIALIAANTMLSASASCLACIVTTRFRFGKPDASLSANGWLGGLVASSAVSCYVSPVGAISVGVIAGLLVTISVEVLEVFLMVDDPGGAISVHAVAGIWGLLAIGIFPRISDASDSIRAGSPAYSGQLLAQVLGVATLVGLMLPLIYALNLLLNRIDPQHSEHGAGRLGMDLVELGGSAYPEFAIHSDE
jgi:Amt family ammonium transporter